VVGRDVLIGLTFGTCLALVSVLARSLVVWLGQPERAPELYGLDALLSARVLLSYLLGFPVNATLNGLGLLLLFLVLRLATRRDWIAAVLVVGFIVSGDLAESNESLWLMLPLSAIAWSSYVLLLLRFGLLAAITAVWSINVLVLVPLLYAPDSWIGSATPAVLPLLILLGVLSFRSARGGHSGLQRYLAGDAPTSRPA
jgi:hypothetical protein